MAYMNQLKTVEEINSYKEWLSSKHSHFLKCLLGIFEMDKNKEKPKYIKLDLRIELVNQELNRRNPL